MLCPPPSIEAFYFSASSGFIRLTFCLESLLAFCDTVLEVSFFVLFLGRVHFSSLCVFSSKYSEALGLDWLGLVLTTCYSHGSGSVTPPISRSGPTRLADPNRSPRRETIYILYCTGTLIDLFFLRVVLVPVVYKQFLK